MCKSLWASSMRGRLCELVAVGPGRSGVRAAKVQIESQWPPGLQLFPLLVTSLSFSPLLGEKLRVTLTTSKKIISL